MNKDALIQELRQLRLEVDAKANQALLKERKNGGKLIRNIERSIENFETDIKNFAVPDFVEAEARLQEKYSQKMYSLSTEIVKQKVIPEVITLSSLETYSKEISEIFQKLDEAVFKKYVKLLDHQFKRKIKALDSSYRRIFKEKRKFDDFLNKKYKPKSSVENDLGQIDALFPLIEDYYEISAKIEERKGELSLKSKQIEDKEQKLKELKNHKVKIKYEEAVQEFSNFQKNFDDELSDLRKALRKYLNSKSKQKGNDDQSFMKAIVSDAATTLATQSNLYAMKDLLEEVKGLLEKRKLEMKKARVDAALKVIKSLLDGELEKLWKTARNSYESRNECKIALDKLELESHENDLLQTINGMKLDRVRIIEREFRESKKVFGEIGKRLKVIIEKQNVLIVTKLDEIGGLDFFENSQY